MYGNVTNLATPDYQFEVILFCADAMGVLSTTCDWEEIWAANEDVALFFLNKGKDALIYPISPNYI